MAQLDDVITYLEMKARPVLPRMPAPPAKLALIRTENCTVSFYRYLYETLAAQITKDTTEIFALYVGGVPAGYFDLDAADPRETELAYFGLIPEFIGRRLGPFLLQAAIRRAGTRRSARL